MRIRFEKFWRNRAAKKFPVMLSLFAIILSIISETGISLSELNNR